MGHVYADIILENYRDVMMVEEGLSTTQNIRSKSYNMMVDSGAIRLTINEEMVKDLGFKIRNYSNATLADGTVLNLGVVGPIKIYFKDRECFTDAYVMPGMNEPLLGVIPLELMDLVIIPSENKLDFNPKHPDGPVFNLK
jgi:clan AA aspartic protease